MKQSYTTGSHSPYRHEVPPFHPLKKYLPTESLSSDPIFSGPLALGLKSIPQHGHLHSSKVLGEGGVALGSFSGFTFHGVITSGWKTCCEFLVEEGKDSESTSLTFLAWLPERN